MRFQAEPGTDTINILGKEYVVDENGGFECDYPEHYAPLRQLGCRGEDEPAPVAAPVVAETPPAIPEGYVSEEAVRALVEENEDMKVAIDKLHKDAAASNQVEEGLRDRIQELEAKLAAPAGDGTADEATETATETHEDTSGASSGSDGGEASEDASEKAD